VNRFLLRKNFDGITLWPILIVRNSELKDNKIFMNHERIHLRQHLEMLVVFYYLWYGIEYLIRLIQFCDSRQAYRNISFEREAYANEKDLDYLKKRPFWSFKGYL